MSRFSQSEVDSVLSEQDDEEIEVTPVEVDDESSPSAQAAAEVPVSEVPSTEAPAPDATEAQPITRDDGATWSEKAGRWYKDGKIVAGEAPTPSEPSIPKVETPVAPVAEVPPVPVVPTFTGDPFEVRGGGRKHAIPGAVIDKDGWTHIPPDTRGQISTLIAAGIHHNSTWQQERQTFQQQIKDAGAIGEARAAKYNGAASMLWEHIANPEWLVAAAQNPEYIELLKEKLGIALQKADLKVPQAPAQPEQTQEDLEARFSMTLEASTDELLDAAPRGLLTAEDVQDIKKAVALRMAAYADEHEGEVVLDFHKLRDDVQREIKLIERAHQRETAAREQATKAKAAAAFNAANTPKASVVPPKQPTPKPALAAVPSGQKRGWDQAVKDAWADDTDDE